MTGRRQSARSSERPGPARAAQYLRMSTASQPHSLAQQAATISAYAQGKGYEITKTYQDAAVSGIDVKKRPAFRQLLAAVLGGCAEFEVILVYDVSRWGRFQDPDEAAHYEYLCGQEGVRIEYCAEAFGDGLVSHDALMKSLKRAMAAEYSRELGAKVARAQARLAAQGRWQHGRPGYGLRRRLVSAAGELGEVLQDGERKSDPGRHTILAAGPAREVRTVRRIHAMCGRSAMTPAQIAAALNAQGEPGLGGAPWSGPRVREILTSPKYAGQLVTGKRHTPLGGKTILRPQDQWIVADGAPRLVSKRAFAASQAALARQARPTTEALLKQLGQIAEAHGVVSEPRLRDLGVAHPRAYRARFGSLRAAFAAIGHLPGRSFPKKMDDRAMLKGLAKLFERQGDITSSLIDAAADIPCADQYSRRFGSLAKAYAQIGFVRISAAEARSALGKARLEARSVRIGQWARSAGPG